MMSSMTKQKSLWQMGSEDYLLKLAARARRRNKPLKTRSPRDLAFYLEHGWKVLSHTQPSYGQGQYWLLVPEAE